MSDKPVKPNLIGLLTGLVMFALFAVTHYAFGFPRMLIHVFIIPIGVGLIMRYYLNLEHGDPWRRD